ncbi:MAG: ABC transporter permease, partial [Acidobacteriota bacterium]
AALRARDIDLAASFEPAEEAGGADNFRVILSLQSAEERSQTAEKRFDEVLGEYRRDWTRRSARELGISDAEWEMLSVETRNIASSESVGAFLLALIVPLLMILMITAGCFYPAVDTTAGERERSTWETLMSSGARRSSVLVSKYLYVAALGTVAGLLNLIAMTLSMRALLAPLLGDSSDEVTFTLPWRALPLMLLTALLLALFIAALMMLFAVFARTFKEGQAMIGPADMVCMLPPLFVMSPDLELTLGWAAIPVANVALLFRGAMTGTVTWTLALAVLAVQAALIVLLLALARWILSIEEVLTGSYGGSLGKLIFSRLKGGRFGHREADPAEEKRRE